MNKIFEQVNIINQNIYVTYLDNINHDKVALDIEKYSIGIEKESPEYGWISRGFVQYEDLVVPVTAEITKLEDAILSSMTELTGKEYQIDDMWSVKLIKNQSVIAHSHHSNLHAHPDEYYSIAYYPQVPDGSAELIFMSDWCGIMQTTKSIAPKKGMLVVFNSYLKHMTARHQIEESRLVVSMNLSPKQPNKNPNADWSVYWNRPIINETEI